MMEGIQRIGASVRFMAVLALLWWPMVSEAELVDRIVAQLTVRTKNVNCSLKFDRTCSTE
jgi:hypothetical protein